MEYASVTGYSTEPLNFFSANELLDGSEPISVVQNTYKDPIVIKEILMDSLQGKEILPIDDKDYKNKEVDEMISKMNEFTETFHKLQTELDELQKVYNHEAKSTQDNIVKLDTTIHYMKVMNDEYDKDKTITEIMDKMNSYAEKIKENDKLKDAKDNYIVKRKELNSYLYFIQNLNKWNLSAICPICITDKIDSYCNPCGHTACKKCLDRNASIVNNVNHNKCPICRDYVMDIRKLYFI
tara:strand:- start:65 stop:781 length:717 start_codon:yes stop_codon:yes gene_type:complete